MRPDDSLPPGGSGRTCGSDGLKAGNEASAAAVASILSQSRRAAIGGLLLLLSTSVGVAQQTWPVTRGEPSIVDLEQYKSGSNWFLEQLWPSHRDITLHEFSERVSPRRGHYEVQTTGNSITFRLDDTRLSLSLISGSGPKLMLPITLYYSDGKITSDAPSKRPYKQSIQAILSSASLEKIEAFQRFNYDPGMPSASALQRARLARRRNPSELDPRYYRGALASFSDKTVSYSGKQYCGFEMFRQPGEFSGLNDIAIADLPTPFDSENIFVKFNRSDEIQQLVFCKPNPNSSYCFANGFFNEWLPYSIGFDSTYLCNADDISSKVLSWLESRVIGETFAVAP